MLYPRLSIVQCHCGHVYYNQQVSPEELKKIYGENYFIGDEYVNYKEEKCIIQKNFKQRLKYLGHYKTKGQLLEIGCAYGFFLDLAKDNFAVSGFEICQEAAQYARKELKLDVITNDFLATELPENHYDVVCLYDCIEHLERPDLFLSKVYHVLKPQGVVVITTGDMGSLMSRWQKEKWRMIHPPTHIHYFSKKSMSNLLGKIGFIEEKFHYPGMWRSFALLVARLLGWKNLAKKIPGSFWVNTFDIFEVVAKKGSY
jgi:2-polyprenyl-3-methyl-5-hydroxy-6-metoxy-1,4-benzoquinol methylase